MSASLRLVVTTPLSTLVDATGIVAVRAEDASGGFGVLPGHARLLTALPPSILRWREADRRERFCAVASGVLTVDQMQVRVACREGVVSDDLDILAQEVARMRAAEAELARNQRVEAVQLEARALRRLLALLHGSEAAFAAPFAGQVL